MSAASPSDVFNMVSLSTVDYADATVDGSMPTVWIPIKLVEQGKFNPDFKPGTVTKMYDAKTQQPYYVYEGPGDSKIAVSLPKATLQDVANFTGATVVNGKLSAGAIKMSTPKIFRFTGTTIEGRQCTLIALHAFVSSTWSGPIDAAQAAVSLLLDLELTTDNADPPQLVTFEVF